MINNAAKAELSLNNGLTRLTTLNNDQIDIGRMIGGDFFVDHVLSKEDAMKLAKWLCEQYGTDVAMKETLHLCCKCGEIEIFQCKYHGHAAYVCSDCAVAMTF